MWFPQLIAGPILWYIITRDDVEIYRDPFKLELVDNNAIQPYRTYIYQLTVCNGAGCVNSIEVSIVIRPTIIIELSKNILNDHKTNLKCQSQLELLNTKFRFVLSILKLWDCQSSNVLARHQIQNVF